jgi:DNA-binding NtrC family response regulator
VSQAVLVLDDDSDLRSLLCELLTSEGVDCFAAGTLGDVIALGSRALGCNLAILDVNLGPGQPSGVDAYRWMKGHAFGGRIVFLTGHASSFAGVAEAHALGVTVLEKPVSADAILDLVGDGTAA